MRVNVGSCGKGVGCVTGSELEGDAVEEVVIAVDVPSSSVLEAMPKSAVVVAEST
jgi:hypothetical protein